MAARAVVGAGAAGGAGGASAPAGGGAGGGTGSAGWAWAARAIATRTRAVGSAFMSIGDGRVGYQHPVVAVVVADGLGDGADVGGVGRAGVDARGGLTHAVGL